MSSWSISLDNMDVNIPEDIFLLDTVLQVVHGVDMFSDKHQHDAPRLQYL